MTGNVHLKVDSSSTSPPRFTQVLIYFSRLTCPSRYRSYMFVAQIYQYFRRVVEGECDFLHSNHHGPC